MRKVIDEILEKHTKICTCREVYKLNEDIDITINQKDEKITMRGINNRTDRDVNLSTKRFKRLMDGFRAVSSDLYSDSKYYHITLNPNPSHSCSSGSRGIDSYELEIEQLKEKIVSLNKTISKLEKEVSEYRSLLKPNARGAGRKVKFTDEQIVEIKQLREDGKTIKDISNKYHCSVGLIHKLINEK